MLVKMFSQILFSFAELSSLCSAEEVEALSDTHDLCIGGDCFEMLQRTSAVLQVVPFVKVFETEPK